MIFVRICKFAVGVVAFCGCSTSDYAERADKDVYAILSQAEGKLFGTASNFSLKGPDPDSAETTTTTGILKAGAVGEKVTLDLDETLAYAIANSRDYQSQKERLYLTGLTLTTQRHSFRPQFFGRSRANYLRESDGDRRGSLSSGLGLDQAFKTGGSLGLSVANDLLKYFTGDPRRSAASVLQLNVLQPIFRGAGRDIAGEQLTQANRNVIYAVRDFNHYQNTFSVDIVNQYFDLLQQKQVVFNQYNNYLSRKANRAYLTARFDRESPEAIDDSKQDVLAAKNRYLEAVTSYRNSLDRFKITLGLPQKTELRLDDSEIERVREVGATSFAMPAAAAFEIALGNRLPLFNQIDRFEDERRQVGLAADRLRTELNIVGNSSLRNSGGPTDYTRFNFKDVRAEVGLQLNLPLDRLRERNNYRATLINFEAATRELSQDFDELRNLLDRRLRELSQFQASYQIQKGAVRLAERRVEANQLRLQAGRVIFRRLSEAQDALILAQNAETRALVDFLNARLNLFTELGVIDTGISRYWLAGVPAVLEPFAAIPPPPPELDEEGEAEVIPPEILFE